MGRRVGNRFGDGRRPDGNGEIRLGDALQPGDIDARGLHLIAVQIEIEVLVGARFRGGHRMNNPHLGAEGFRKIGYKAEERQGLFR
jgi:hypothetical protein